MWTKISESEVPSGVRFGCLDQRNAGQMVEIEDGFVGGATPAPYRRTRDQSVGPDWTYERDFERGREWDERAKLATEMAELSDRICRLEDLGKDAPRGTIRGLKQRLDALRKASGGAADR